MLFIVTLLLLGWALNVLTIGIAGSYLLAVPIMFCLGSIVFTDFAFLTACLLAPYSSAAINASYYISLFCSWLIIIFCYLRREKISNTLKAGKFDIDAKKELLIMFFCLTISYLFFFRHLIQIDGTLFNSIIFWDFPVHFSRINSFIMGNNFPPRDPLFGGAPLTYHFMFHMLEALSLTSGMRTDTGTIIISTFSFSCLLMLIAKFMLSLGYGLRGAATALALFLTGSSLRIFYDIHMYLIEGWKYFSSPAYTFPFRNAQYSRYWYEFYGQHFSLFYFLEERRLGFACLFMLLVFYILSFHIDNIKRKQIIALGLLVGSFFFWHLHVALIISLVLLLTFLSYKEWRKLILPILLISVGLIFMQTVFIRYLQTDTAFFDHTIEKFSKIDFSFPSPDREGSLIRTIAFIVLAYGVKLIFLPKGLNSIKTISKGSYYLMLYSLSGIVVAFTLKLNTGHIHENHKWIVLSSPALNIIAAAGVIHWYEILKQKISSLLPKLLISAVFIFFLTYGGLIENIPFFRSQKYGELGNLNSEMVRHIKLSFPQNAVFISYNWPLVHLSGRAVYLSSRSHPATALAIEKRSIMQRAILNSSSKEELCSLLKMEKIDGALYAKDEPDFAKFDRNLSPYNEAYMDFRSHKQLIRVINVSAACKE